MTEERGWEIVHLALCVHEVQALVHPRFPRMPMHEFPDVHSNIPIQWPGGTLLRAAASLLPRY